MSTPTSNDPNFFRNDGVVFGNVKLTDTSAQLQGPGGKSYSLPAANGTLKASGGGQPVNTPTFGATISVDPTVGDVVVVNGVSSVSATSTLNLASVPPAGQSLTFILNASGSGTVTYTFGTSFRVTGTVAVTASTAVVVTFISDGVSALQAARTVSTAVAPLS